MKQFNLNIFPNNFQIIFKTYQFWLLLKMNDKWVVYSLRVQYGLNLALFGLKTQNTLSFIPQGFLNSERIDVKTSKYSYII